MYLDEAIRQSYNNFKYTKRYNGKLYYFRGNKYIIIEAIKPCFKPLNNLRAIVIARGVQGGVRVGFKYKNKIILK